MMVIMIAIAVRIVLPMLPPCLDAFLRMKRTRLHKTRTGRPGPLCDARVASVSSRAPANSSSAEIIDFGARRVCEGYIGIIEKKMDTTIIWVGV